MRLDHLLSKEKVRVELLSSCQGVHGADFGRAPERMFTSGTVGGQKKSYGRSRKTQLDNSTSGDDALKGHTRSHPEHDG